MCTDATGGGCRCSWRGCCSPSRLRKDAALFDVPTPHKPGQRGRPRKYGTHRIDLAKRAASVSPERIKAITRGSRLPAKILNITRWLAKLAA